jgi:hypothetical protein
MFLMPGQERVDDEGDGRNYDFKTGHDFYSHINSQSGIIPRIKVANYSGNYTYIASGDEGSIWKYDDGTQPKIIKLPIYDNTSHPKTLEEIKKFITEFSKAEFNKFDTISKKFEESILLKRLREHITPVQKIDIKLINTTLINGKISNKKELELSKEKETVSEHEKDAGLEEYVELISRPYYTSLLSSRDTEINRINSKLEEANINIKDINKDNVIKTGEKEFVIIDFNQV